MLGLLLTVPLAGGPIEIGSVTLSLYTMLLGLALTVIGLQGIFLGCVAQVLFDYTGKATRRWLRVFPYDRTMGIAALLALIGLAAFVPLVVEWLDRGFELGDPGSSENHLAVFGATLLLAAFSTFAFTLILHGAHRDRDEAADGRARSPMARTVRRPLSTASASGSAPVRSDATPSSRERGSATSAAATRRSSSARCCPRCAARSPSTSRSIRRLSASTKVEAIEGPLDQVLPTVPSDSIDVVLCLSVLEHLWEPEAALSEFARVVSPGGTVLINVPSWRGKRFLELAAFRLGVSPKEEMDDHKRYYDPADLWPLLVGAGFRPSRISCRRHKFGLNTFAACRADEEEA